MSEKIISKWIVITPEGQAVELEHDLEGDMLEIFFDRRSASGAVELAEPLILRFDRETGCPLSLSILTFSKISQLTEFGPQAFPLNGLEAMPIALRKLMLSLLQTPPLTHFLKIMAYTHVPQQSPIPLSYMDRSPLLNVAMA